MIYNIFHVFLLEQHILRKKRVIKKLLKLEKEFEARDNKQYEVKVIIDSVIYGKKANNQIPGFYYLVM